MKQRFLVLTAFLLLAIPLLGDVTHTVERGETMYAIARKYGVPLAQLLSDNDIKPDEVTKVPVGRKLVIKGVDAPAPAPVATVDYVVRKDETFWAISRRFGLTMDELEALNPGVDPQRIREGLRLKVPASATDTPAPAATRATDTPAGSSTVTGAATQTAATTSAGNTAANPAPLTALPRAAGTESELWPLPGPRVPVKDGNFDHIRIQAKAGDPVIAVSSGQVRYVAPFHTYRYIVIIETRASSSRVYRFWYAGVDDVYVRAGEWVNKGATIARVAPNGIDGKPQVAFGVYQGTTPIDHTRLVWQ